MHHEHVASRQAPRAAFRIAAYTSGQVDGRAQPHEQLCHLDVAESSHQMQRGHSLRRNRPL
jgi:hypothetical protein